MRRAFLLFTVILLLWVNTSLQGGTMESIQLPEPRREGDVSLEETLQRRHSVRDLKETALTLDVVSQILWATQGINAEGGGRTAPSAGALYPLELILVVGRVEKLEAGVYRYRPRHHDLLRHASGDRRAPLAKAALHQEWIGEAPAVLVIAAVFERTTVKYGQRGRRYVHMEVGLAAENAHLMVTALRLGTTVVGAFEDEAVRRALDLPPEIEPFVLMPVGHLR